MTASAKRKKTATQQRAKVADKAPHVHLVPDEAGEQHARAAEHGCAATRWLTGHQVQCELAALHGGNHEYQGRTWRPRSGDDI